MKSRLLVLNCGSSSIKFAVFDGDHAPLPRQPLWNGRIEGIGAGNTRFILNQHEDKRLELLGGQPYHAALEYILMRVHDLLGDGRLAAVAHRVVHGGSRYFSPVVVTPAIMGDLRSYIPLAPLHQPFALDAIDTLLVQYPDLPQVACFDTAFHHTLPDVETMMPLDWHAWETGLRRYGFHGLSYEYMSIALAQRYGARAKGRTIVAHIGSGASLCAMQGLRSMATTMGFSALDGLMMSTRCGALDPGAVIYLMQIKKLSLDEVGQLLYHQSGLKGISGLSGDVRVLLENEAVDEKARAALALYVRRIVREIGALTAVLGGLDMLVFTAGVGERGAAIRERICAALGYLGVALNASANARNARQISSDNSQVLVAVEDTNEEWIAALRAQELASAAIA